MVDGADPSRSRRADGGHSPSGVDLPDLDEIEDGRRFPLRTWGFLATLAGIGAAFAYDYRVLGPRDPVAFGWDLAPHEWLFLPSLAVALFYVVLPLARRPPLVRRYWRELRRSPVGLASFGFLAVAFLAGMVGPVFYGEPTAGLGTATYQPPFGVGVPTELVAQCAGRVVDGTCYGSLAHPLGTDGNGRDMLVYVVYGLRVASEVAFVTAMLVVPAAVVVGTVAAEFGGRVDAALMRFVDLQQTVPAFFVYIVVQYVFEPRLWILLAVFGLLSWGSVARLVRSEALQREGEAYVLAAESAGAGRFTVLRRHVVPNVASTVVAAVTLQIPTLILLEAALAYLGFGDPTVYSFGWAISATTNRAEFPLYWWLSAVPALVLLSTVVALNLFGDALRDVLDPRLEARR